VIVFPNCKINLGLNIIRKRTDGFHDIESVFYPVGLTDALEVVTAGNSTEPLQFSASGLAIEGATETNLCHNAFSMLKKFFPQIPPTQMHLHKAIPIGAGLGGGSSDAAFTLKLLNMKFGLEITTESLLDFALQLGSDCPFFIMNKPCFASGRGEFLESINIDLGAYKIVIVNPGIHISTAEVFSMVKPVHPSKSIRQVIQQPLLSWKNELKNDFEEIIFAAHPEIGDIKDELYRTGALYASMTGSGSSVYGIFEKSNEPGFSFPSTYFVKQLIGEAQ
jgi:4-diphosphocytidyl-2-C-methyl-D-erythritol kinase